MNRSNTLTALCRLGLAKRAGLGRLGKTLGMFSKVPKSLYGAGAAAASTGKTRVMKGMLTPSTLGSQPTQMQAAINTMKQNARIAGVAPTRQQYQGVIDRGGWGHLSKNVAKENLRTGRSMLEQLNTSMGVPGVYT